MKSRHKGGRAAFAGPGRTIDASCRLRRARVPACCSAIWWSKPLRSRGYRSLPSAGISPMSCRFRTTTGRRSINGRLL